MTTSRSGPASLLETQEVQLQWKKVVVKALAEYG